MLSRVQVSETPQSGRQIAVSASTSGAVMYVVPPGRTFVGIASGNNSSSALRINGGDLLMSVHSTGANSVPFPLTLVAGTVVVCANGNQVCLVGVEQ